MTIDHARLARLIAPARALALDYAAPRATLAVDEKSPTQFATEADRAVETVIRETLRAEFGAASILGEEDGGGLDGDGTGWAIDPIDGTSNFLRGLPLWAISIGYVERGVPVAGVVALPQLGEMLSAVKGEGLMRNGQIFVPPPAGHPVRMIALGENDLEPGPQTDARAQHFRDRGFTVVRYNCAVFALTGAALGWNDGYVEHGCGLWDIAAGAVICGEAGLAVSFGEIAPGRWRIEALGANARSAAG